jgi:hypothetical protein
MTIEQMPDSTILAIPVMGTVKNDLKEREAEYTNNGHGETEVGISNCTHFIDGRNRRLREFAVAGVNPHFTCSTTEFINIPGGAYGRSGNLLIELTHGLWLARRMNRTFAIPPWMYRVIEPFNTSLLSSIFCFRVGLDPSTPGIDVLSLDSGALFFGTGLFTDERFKHKLPPLPKYELNGTILHELSAHFMSVYLALWSSPSSHIIRSSCEVIKRKLDDNFSYASAHKRSLENACSHIMSDNVHIDEFNNTELPMNSPAWQDAKNRHPLCGEGMTFSFIDDILKMHRRDRANQKLFMLFDGQSDISDFVASNATILSVGESKMFTPDYSVGFGRDTMLIEMYIAMHGELFIMNPRSTLSLQVFVVRAALGLTSVPTLRNHDIYLGTLKRAAMVWITYGAILNQGTQLRIATAA